MADLTVTYGTTKQAASVSNFASGSFATGAGDAIAVAVTTGFKPRYVKLVDETNTTIYEKLDGQASANTVKTLPGTTGANDTVTTIDASGSLIVFTDRGFTVASGAAVASASFAWIAFG